MNSQDTAPKGKAKGGVARAAALSDDERRAIAKKGAAARWHGAQVDPASVEIAKSPGELEIGDTVIGCAVLEDGTRVLSERAITKAFGGKRGGSHWLRMKQEEGGAYLPVFLSANNIKPFIDKDLQDGLGRRRIYRANKAAAPSFGMEATLLPKICNLYLRMRDAKKLTKPQAKLAIQADLIMRGLAEVGIVALVDEATGHISEKRKDEYRQLFKDFIEQQARGWSQEFPDQFFDMIYKLYGLQRGKKGRHPQFFAHFTRKYIYEPLAGSNGMILEMLDEKNPVVYKRGGRRYKLHQFLTDQIGLPTFRAHMWQVVGIGLSNESKQGFDRGFSRVFPKSGDQMDWVG